ncbi:MAG: hypothetical protein KDJ88_21980 [Bauldia sp.]|nr:hypothetical protein [Bauldia sp.]
MYVAVLARRLRPGKTYADFVAAWYPDKGFGVPVDGPILATGTADDREIIAIAFLDLPDRPSLEEAMARVAAQEEVRHERIAAVIEATTLRGLYEVADRFDFSTDATVEATRPGTRR